MDSKLIEQLLNRYFSGETTVQEEALLRDFFCEDNVPASLESYKDLFVYQQLSAEDKLGADFDERMLSMVQAPVVKARKVTLLIRLMPMFKAAAAVAFLLLLGNVVEHSLSSGGVNEIAATDTIGEQITAPSVAVTDEVLVNDQPADSLEVPVNVILKNDNLNNN